ncbi:Malonyl-CoA O-methyltransferase BioC [Hartmannibacter diazotrophicus]|uniref:Malonyl-CoA O-methyltransferase BioC n=1 Tax=Hartmannibacter diazotrophicus TaxID=1482074 RepID=A0A2C9DDL5_9HYPH|nr:methyltransferase domain-containing protein [Hartmannibacter diazotrophicus]SON58343.1 Malonyl-CoA O-methyltransferase BioC [Hartmannibacter diazotrophicus]
MALAPSSLSSGDLLADRRFEYARLLETDGDFAAAADLYAQALEIAPGWAACLFALASAQAKAGNATAAREAFETLLALDPEDHFGASLQLSLIGDEPAPDIAPPAYVRALFDDYADRFEASLVEALQYRAPKLIGAAIERVRHGKIFAHALDLGCGTGLMAEALSERVGHMEGVDLSPDMVAAARAKGLYAALREGDVVDDLSRAGEAYDLVTAADVFVYMGDLAAVFAAVSGRLVPGGLFAFSVELSEGEDWVLRPSLRYAHAPEYLGRLALAHGFLIRSMEPADLRLDRGEPVRGLVCVLEMPRAAHSVEIALPARMPEVAAMPAAEAVVLADAEGLPLPG